MLIPDFDEYEREVIRSLAKSFNEGNAKLDYAQIPRYEEVGKERVDAIIKRLATFGYIRWEDIGRMHIRVFFIAPTIMELAHSLDNPPPKDYWKDCETWFRSKWWSVPVFVLFIGLPAVVGYIAMLKQLLEWFGIWQ